MGRTEMEVLESISLMTYYNSQSMWWLQAICLQYYWIYRCRILPHFVFTCLFMIAGSLIFITFLVSSQYKSAKTPSSCMLLLHYEWKIDWSGYKASIIGGARHGDFFIVKRNSGSFGALLSSFEIIKMELAVV